MPYVMSPPPFSSFSKIVTSTPFRASTCAQLNPAGPAPTTATFFPVDGFRSKSFHFPSRAFSVEYRCSLAMWMGVSCSRLNTHAPSHSFSTGHTFEHPAPMMFDSNIVFADPFTLSVVICLMNLGTLIPVGQLFVHGAS